MICSVHLTLSFSYPLKDVLVVLSFFKREHLYFPLLVLLKFLGVYGWHESYVMICEMMVCSRIFQKDEFVAHKKLMTICNQVPK